MFQAHCKRKSLPEFWQDRHVPSDNSNEHNCIPDDHYVQTLLAQNGLEREITRRTLTHTSWDLSSAREYDRRGWHPITYKLADAAPLLVQSIRICKDQISKAIVSLNPSVLSLSPAALFFLGAALGSLMSLAIVTALIIICFGFTVWLPVK